jgi:dolichol kinase
MGRVERIVGLVLLGAGLALHCLAWPWASALGIVLACTFSLILTGKSGLSVLFMFPAIWFLGFLAEGSIPCLAILGLTVAAPGALALRYRLLWEWKVLADEQLPFLAKRKLYRMCGLVFPLVVFPLWGNGVYRLTLGVPALAILIAEVARKRSERFDRGFRRFFAGVSKKEEADNVSGTAWYLWGAAIASSFPGAIGPAAVVMMTLGDAWAVITGVRWGRRHILGKKTLLGTAACFAVAFIAGFVFADMNSAVPVRPAVFLAAALVSAVSELVTPGRWDNLTVAPATAFAIWALRLFL